MRTAFLFPGQGAQSLGFLHALPDRPLIRETLEEASGVLALDCSQLDSAASLDSTLAVQLGLVIAGFAYARLLAAKGARPDAVAGLSVGAFTAAAVAGALDFEDALRLVRVRGEAMQRAFGKGGFGMLAILGLPETAIGSLIERVAGGSSALYLASVNAPAEMVLAGSDAALAAAEQAARRAGARTRRLSVSVPSHGPPLEGVSTALRRAMAGVRLHPARVPYVGNHRARALLRGEDIAEDLIVNVSRTVRWHESMTLLYELGCRLFVETPPGRALSNLVRGEFAQARPVAAVDVDGDSVAHLVKLAAERAGGGAPR
ncbi:MAG TPA: acyltransferase domain-containing protein [Steroidobacteraceae bacterium]|nr:acyltransferase domain-containing protein [Steroidobacteraceae bacterium]